jgi:hypothetical protein
MSCGNRSFQLSLKRRRTPQVVSASSAGQPLQPPVEFDAPTHRLQQASGLTNEADGRPGSGGGRQPARQEVKISDAERFVICSSPEQADRDAAVRERLLAQLEETIAGSDELSVSKGRP